MRTSPYIAAFFSSMRQILRDRGSLAFRSLFFIVILVINSAVWYAATDGATREIQGYSHADLLWYIMFTEVVVFAAPAVRVEQVGGDIGTRAIEADMLRPTSVLGLRLATDYGTFVGRGLAMLMCGLVVSPFLAGEPIHYVGVLLGIPAALLAIACSGAAIYAFAAVSFWVRDAKSTWFVFQKMIFLLGGMLFPLQFLPQWGESIAWALPFWTMAYAAGNFAAGNTNWFLVAGQIAWLGVLLGLTRFVFNAGERRLQAGL